MIDKYLVFRRFGHNGDLEYLYLDKAARSWWEADISKATALTFNQAQYQARTFNKEAQEYRSMHVYGYTKKEI